MLCTLRDSRALPYWPQLVPQLSISQAISFLKKRAPHPSLLLLLTCPILFDGQVSHSHQETYYHLILYGPFTRATGQQKTQHLSLLMQRPHRSSRRHRNWGRISAAAHYHLSSGTALYQLDPQQNSSQAFSFLVCLFCRPVQLFSLVIWLLAPMKKKPHTQRTPS
jgi:hypothetical protein